VGDAIDEGMLVSFEPFNPNVRRLRENLAHNGVTAIVEPYGLAEFDGSLEVPVTRQETGVFISSALDPFEIETGESTVQFPTSRGDTVIERGDVPAPDVIRIDTSGGEPRVLAGLGEYLRDCRVIYATAYRHRYDHKAVIESRLQDAGFVIDIVDSPADLDILKGTVDE
jgi:FkbM family methyltransferase